jgi:hypothetical protein
MVQLSELTGYARIWLASADGTVCLHGKVYVPKDYGSGVETMPTDPLRWDYTGHNKRTYKKIKSV